MTEWTQIHPDFTEELVKEWLDKGFNCEDARKWIENGSLILEDADFADWLLKKRGLVSEVVDDILDELREDYEKTKKMEVTRDWRDIRPDFTPQLINGWKNLGFDYNQTQEWINISLSPTDAEFCAWLRDVVEQEVEDILNHGNVKELRDMFREYLLGKNLIEIPPKNNFDMR